MKLGKFAFIGLMVIFSKSLSSQVNKSNFENLICKEWLLKYYEVEGNKFPPSPENEKDLMIFFKDNKVQSREYDKIQNGIWEFDGLQQTLTIVDIDTKEKVVLKVLKITMSEFVMEYMDPDGTKIIMHMYPKQ